jgi:Universal stress protein family
MNTTLNRILLAAYGSEGTEFVAHAAIHLARGRSVIGRALMGSVSDSVVRHSPCPVVVARSQEADDKRKGDPRPGNLPWDTGKTSSAWSGIRWAIERGYRTY